jgi:hypothetical protein
MFRQKMKFDYKTDFKWNVLPFLIKMFFSLDAY